MSSNARLLNGSCVAFATSLILLQSAIGHAAEITYNFSGTVTSNFGWKATYSNPGGYDANGGITPGTPFSGSFTYDTQLPSTNDSGYENIKYYGYSGQPGSSPAPVLSVRVNFDGFASYASTDQTPRHIDITDDYKTSGRGSGIDLFEISLNEESGQSINIGFYDTTGRALDSTAIPASLDLAAFAQAPSRAYLWFGSKEGVVSYGGLTSLEIQPVPEPSVLAIFGLIVPVLAVARRCRCAR